VPLWTNRYNGPGNGDDFPYAMAVDGSGNVFVTGHSEGSVSSTDYATIKYSNAGVPLWTNRYDGLGHDYDIPSAMAVDDSGNVFVAGYSTRSSGGFDMTTIKYAGTRVSLQITAAEKLGNDLRLRFTSQTGFHYNIQARADLAAGDWINAVTNVPSGGPISEITVTNALQAARQFYRIQQLP
jgi:hypothetical protein